MSQIKSISIVYLLWLLDPLYAEIATKTVNKDGFKVCADSATAGQGTGNTTASSTDFNVSSTTRSVTQTAFWSVVSGGQYCELVDGGRCVSDGAGRYGNNERCKVVALRPLIIKTAQYAIEHKYDYLTVGGVNYETRAPDGAYLETGGVLLWRSDSSGVLDGFKVCATPAVAFWTVLSGHDYCKIVDGGRCVSAGSSKRGRERCKVAALRPITVHTIHASDSLNDFTMAGVSMAGIRFKNLRLGKGGVMEWASKEPKKKTTTTTTHDLPDPMVRYGSTLQSVVLWTGLASLIPCAVLAYYLYGEDFFGDCFENLRLRQLHSDNEGVIEVDATLKIVTGGMEGGDMEADGMEGFDNNRWLTYSFTGIHPDRGPFRVTVRYNKDVNETDCSQPLAMCYKEVDPRKHAAKSDIADAFNKTCCELKPYAYGCNWHVILCVVLLVLGWVAVISLACVYSFRSVDSINEISSAFIFPTMMALFVLLSYILSFGVCTSICGSCCLCLHVGSCTKIYSDDYYRDHGIEIKYSDNEIELATVTMDAEATATTGVGATVPTDAARGADNNESD